MNRIVSLAAAALLVAGAGGCHCCHGLARFEAWKMNLFFPQYNYQQECCEPAYPVCCEPTTAPCCDPCATPAGCAPANGGVIGTGPAATTPAPTITPAPETYAPSL